MLRDLSQSQKRTNANLHPELQFYIKQRKPKQMNHMAKSSSMASVLGNLSTNIESNTHFIDSLERFRKDYATCDKEQRQRQRQKKLKILEEKKNQQIQRQSRMKNNQYYYDQRNQQKLYQSRLLCAMGIKKNGYSNSLPIDPITLKYHQNPFGNQVKYQDQQKMIKGKVRAHNLQQSSTCGYNLVNGQNLVRVENYIPQNTYGRFETRLGQFYQTRRLDPNINLQLNPKHILPKYVGQPQMQQRGDHSPIKRYHFDDQNNLNTSYNAHYNQRPFDQMNQSRNLQFQVYKQQLANSQIYKGTNPHYPVNQQFNQSKLQKDGLHGQSTVYDPRNQLYELRK